MFRQNSNDRLILVMVCGNGDIKPKLYVEPWWFITLKTLKIAMGT